jgi:hypothetical protein
MLGKVCWFTAALVFIAATVVGISSPGSCSAPFMAGGGGMLFGWLVFEFPWKRKELRV